MADTLLKSDAVTLAARAEKSGHIRLTCAAWEDARVLLPGQVLEVRWMDGQVVLRRLPCVASDMVPTPSGEAAMSRTEIVQRLRQIGALRAGDAPPEWLGANSWGVALSELANAAADDIERRMRQGEAQVSDDLARRIGWAIVTEMHKDVPEDERPLAWCDLSFEQERRIMCAAALAVRMAENKPRHTQFAPERRHARAEAVTAIVMKAIDGLLDTRKQEKDAYRAVFEALYLDGVEMITEAERVRAGLSPRDQNGLTREELMVLDARLLGATTPWVVEMSKIGDPANFDLVGVKDIGAKG